MSPEVDEVPEAIAVVGMAGRFPGAPDVASLDDALRSGTDLTGEPLPDLVTFATGQFGMPVEEAEQVDPQHRLFLEESWRAIEDWGHRPTEQPGVVGVFAACSPSQYLLHRLLPETGRAPAHHSADYLALRTAYHLRLRGPALATQAACAGGLVAIAQGCQSLLDFRCDAALAGAANVTLPEHEYDPSILSPDAFTNAFSADGKGAGFDSGVAVLVLRRLEDALIDGDPVHAVLRGWAVTNDGGRGAGFAAPAVDGQLDAITEAMAVAEVEPEQIDHIEGHGSGTALGDAVEVTALTAALGGAERTVGLSSLKATLGHLDTASGPAAVIKAVLMVSGGYVPAQPRFTEPLDALVGTPFVVPTGEDWTAPRTVGVSSFGVGGANAHVLVGAPPTQEQSRRPIAPTPWPRETCWIGAAP